MSNARQGWIDRLLRYQASGQTVAAFCAQENVPGPSVLPLDTKSRWLFIRDLEQAVNRPTWDTVLAIARVRGVSCEAFTQEPSPEAQEPLKPGRPRKTTEGNEGKEAQGGERPSGDQNAARKRGKDYRC